MHTPPPPYAQLFPNTSTVTDRVFGGPSLLFDSSAFPVGAVMGFAQGGNAAGVELTSPPPPPPPPPTSSSFCTGISAPTIAPPTAGVFRTSKDAVNSDVILQRLFLLQDEINSIKSFLDGQSSPSAPLDVRAAPVRPSSGPPPPPSAASPSHTSPEEMEDAWKRILISQQEQIVSLGDTLCRNLRSMSRAAATATGKVGKEEARTGNDEKAVAVGDTKSNDKQNGNSRTERVYQEASVFSLKDSTVDLVHLLTTLYNLPVVYCGSHHEQLYSKFGEELVAAALGTTSHELLEKYASLLVLRLNEGYAVAECGADAHIPVDVFVAKSGDLVHEVLAPLPLPVLQRVLERTQFPSEIPAYQISFSACESYHHRLLAKSTPGSRAVSLEGPYVGSSSSFLLCASSHHCEAEAAELLFHGVRFLWLPLHFLEKELRRCEGLGMTAEACHCTIYAGLLLRLRQAIQAKRSLKELTTTPARPLPAVFTAKAFLTELNRLRPSYDFLTPSEKEQLLAGSKMDFAQTRRLQERCDATL
ncbi:hypothetical protein MOQ_003590 [Trypanosoma cruzi marinkellei]|uniref:Uncharacterized protein n=1 Tax=Trypanosoma cruzi marinkellei TaxID=85056 RepID=K2MBL4_TRYCR|nr:hypothetical protein MOQ_003590 [Trypanosoma cruzi marinkellei]